MKLGLLVLLLLPLSSYAQRFELLQRPMTSIQGLKSVHIVTTFHEKSGHKPFTDTAFVEDIRYNANGTLALKTYASTLDKATFTAKSTFFYNPECSWSRMMYENNILIDSANSSDCGKIYATRYIFSDKGLHEIYRYSGDSIYNTIVDRPDTIHRAWIEQLTARDPEWDYLHAGTFSRKSTATGAGTDSVRYYNDDGKCIFMIVHQYDVAMHPLKTEYFNYGVKTFVVMKMRYNEKMDITEYAMRSKRNKPSYTIEREFNERGLVAKEKFQWRSKSRNPILKSYNYDFY